MGPEPWLGKAENTLEILNRYGIRLQKKYGQNFLIDSRVLEKIVSFSGIGPDDLVIEIGPGIGTLTQYLASAAGKVCAVEIDSRLIPVLKDTLGAWNNVTVINQDILKMDLSELILELNNGKQAVIVANLPYYITTPVIMKILESKAPVKSMTVMIQKEVAARMQASPGTREYGALSLTVQYYTDAKIVAQVPANCFLPRPDVDSAVIRLDKHENPPVMPADEQKMFRLIRASFNQRRKTLVNGIRNSPAFSYTREEIEAALEKLGKDKNIRGETLTLEEFSRLSDLIGGSC